ncbi:EGT [Alphabaculovirus myunipunctae]|uniref:Ecdysteroid UDP-glucosyltransferase n=1 Tax=Mythimna unipuncta nucleopolyhedrovirus TaxID=447897 RepID=A0A2K9VS65_9ABAC|nr:EGT [Mythimna unipuncta nucleopolyhedrovirus]AUV65294.1 EGT [Mythimna unipuncta nucleopolyhedrovirus]
MAGRVLIIFLATIMMMMSMMVPSSEAARILAIFPTPAYSHHSVYKIYIQALAVRGHDVVVIKSTDRISYTSRDDNDDSVEDNFVVAKKPYNITEIDATLTERDYKRLFRQASVFRKRGLVADSSSVTARNYVSLVRMISDQFDLPVVKEFIARQQEPFDLIIAEAFIDYSLVFSHLFNDAPVVQISSGYAVAENFETMGAVSRHPVYYPNMWRDKFSNLNVWDTIGEIYNELRLQNEFSRLTDEQNELLKRQFGVSTPTIQELRSRVQLLLVNVHAVFDNNRPVPPNVQYLGGLHLAHKRPKPLFGMVREFLDNATAGAIYVSFGSGIDTDAIDGEFVEMLLRTFEALPFAVLWKYDGRLDRMPRNVFVQSWFEQYDLLHHDNVRAFVTQGGVQSTDEAIEALVPMVGMPMMGDQSFNTNKYFELGIGRVVDTVNVNARELVDAITDVAMNQKYRKRLVELRHLIRNQAMSPLHKAIWYTEHVIKNQHHTMLKTKAANVNYSDYIMVNIFVPFAVFSVMNHLRQLLRINLV